MRRYRGSFPREGGHAGTTPMTGPRARLLGLGRSIQAVHATPHRHPPDAVGTAGIVAVQAASTNVIPGLASHTVDFRHPSDATLDAMERELKEAAARIAGELNLQSEVVCGSVTAPVEFNAACVEAVR